MLVCMTQLHFGPTCEESRTTDSADHSEAFGTSDPKLTLDPEFATRFSKDVCVDCGSLTTMLTRFVLGDGIAHAAYFASLHPCAEPATGWPEMWIDAVFSESWDEGSADRTTFGCRIGYVEGEGYPVCTLVDAATEHPDTAAFGHKLSAAEADKHPALPEFRRLVGFALLADDVLRVHMALPTGHPGLAQRT